MIADKRCVGVFPCPWALSSKNFGFPGSLMGLFFNRVNKKGRSPAPWKTMSGGSVHSDGLKSFSGLDFDPTRLQGLRHFSDEVDVQHAVDVAGT